MVTTVTTTNENNTAHFETREPAILLDVRRHLYRHVGFHMLSSTAQKFSSFECILQKKRDKGKHESRIKNKSNFHEGTL